MNETEKSNGSWWQTAPGILTALAGIITALGGLLVVLQQVGLLSDAEKSGFVSPSPSNASTSIQAAAPAAVPGTTSEPANAGPVSKPTKPTAGGQAPRYTVAFPNGAEVIFRGLEGEAIFTILGAQVENGNTGKLSLKLSIRATNKGRYDMVFGTNLFRLLIDDVPRAPTSFLSELVAARSAKEGDITFEIPDTSRNLVLSVNDGQNASNLSITLQKSG